MLFQFNLAWLDFYIKTTMRRFENLVFREKVAAKMKYRKKNQAKASSMSNVQQGGIDKGACQQRQGGEIAERSTPLCSPKPLPLTKGRTF